MDLAFFQELEMQLILMEFSTFIQQFAELLTSHHCTFTCQSFITFRWSDRTNNLVSQPTVSALRDQAIRLAHSLSVDNFTILGSKPSEINLRILESIFIFKCKPKLNEIQSAVPLEIVNRWYLNRAHNGVNLWNLSRLMYVVRFLIVSIFAHS